MAGRRAHEVPPNLAGAHPAATVVLLRDAPSGPEVLMVRRHASLAFHGGAWVFPGGRIDEEDFKATDTGIIAAARHAARREAREEAGVEVAADQLRLLSRWVTPEGLPKRFDTWFFVGLASGEEVTVDGKEIDAHRWLRPDAALAAQGRSEIELPPPTFVTLAGLVAHTNVASVLSSLEDQAAQLFFPRMCVVEGGACTLYEGDAGYADCDAHLEGYRHRLWMLESGWRYECSSELIAND